MTRPQGEGSQDGGSAGAIEALCVLAGVSRAAYYRHWQDHAPLAQEPFLAKRIVTSLAREREEGRSLALLKPEVLGFDVERKSDSDLREETAKFAALRNQTDLFNTKPIIPYKPCPYRFRYRYRTDDGEREGTCQDWEIEATFFRWSRASGEADAPEKMRQLFGVDYPQRGMLLAMGTHSLYPDTWLINGIIRLDNVEQLALI